MVEFIFHKVIQIQHRARQNGSPIVQDMDSASVQINHLSCSRFKTLCETICYESSQNVDAYYKKVDLE